jgi:hydroxymethylpyrimidine/phosphomethylpyrimidine kinase
VFDPFMVTTSCSALAVAANVSAFDRLMELAAITTPNVAELEALGGPQGMARRAAAYLAKGGDAEGPEIEDRLVRRGAEDRVWRSPRIDTRHTHGTGCTLSSAIATLLGQGLPLEGAIEGARALVRAALMAAPGFGAGHGPMGHQAVR